MIIPLNSPCYYAPYNGSIEHAQGEIKSYLKTRNTGSASDLMLQIRIGTHRLNHRPRRSLKGHNACHAYFNGNRQVYNRRKRQQIFDWIKELSIEISTKAGMEKISPSVWRFACQKWMEENGVITVKKWRKVLPDFSLNFYQN